MISFTGILLLCASITMGQSDYEDSEAHHSTHPFTLTTIESTLPTTTKDYCHCDMEIYGPDELDGVLKSPNFPGSHCDSGKCIYKILPHPNMTVRLDVETASFSSGTVLRFWNLFYKDGKEYSLFHSEYSTNSIGSYDRYNYGSRGFDDYDIWTTAKNVGFKLVFEPEQNRYTYNGFKITFERKAADNDNEVCSDSVVSVGSTETVVLDSKLFSISSGCTFLLTSANGVSERKSEEMLIDISTEDGTYVAVRSFDDTGLFALDSFYDYNRVVLVDALKVEILVRQRKSEHDEYRMPKITARLINQTCHCPDPEKKFDANTNKIIVRSPGFPNLYCPGKVCRTLIVSEKVDHGKNVSLILVSTNCTLGENDDLTLSAVDSDRIIFRTEQESIRSKSVRPIAVNEQDLEITFKSDENIQKRYFEMNLTRVYVPPDCVCSVYNDKDYENAGSLSAVIPAKCNILHCHWKFSAGSTYPQQYVSIEFYMSQPTHGDKVFIITDTVTEEYASELLTHKRSLTSATSPIEFTFSRLNLTAETDAVLNVSWKFVEACSCADDKFYLKTGEPVVLASPNYPEMYCPNLVCRHTFYAPKGHFLEITIDQVDVELYHDFLKIYDGNGTGDALLAKISGIKENLNYNTTSNIAYIIFMSDESVSHKGFHANIIARPSPFQDIPETHHWLIFLILIMCICGFSAGSVHWIMRRRKSASQLQSLNNPTISYAASETGSSVSISFNSGSGVITEMCSQNQAI